MRKIGSDVDLETAGHQCIYCIFCIYYLSIVIDEPMSQHPAARRVAVDEVRFGYLYLHKANLTD